MDDEDVILEDFDFDIHSKKILLDRSLGPTKVLREEARWLYAGNNKYMDYELNYEKIGKWMIFPPKSDVDEVWNKIKEAIKEGHLWHSKVCTTDLSDPTYAIMIYTKDYNDKNDVIAVLNYLEASGIKPANRVIHYKTDQQTRAGIYSGGKQKASIYSSNTIKPDRPSWRTDNRSSAGQTDGPSWRTDRSPRGLNSDILSWRTPVQGSTSSTTSSKKV